MEADSKEIRVPDAFTELVDGPQAEAAAKQPEDSVPTVLKMPPAELSDGQPADSGSDQEAADADASDGTQSASACVSGQLLPTDFV